ncbi:DUF3164 family protein [Chrysiogenes arsenatis]|uniref:DUF3164 family protein n=1 Tax=Chrysiogenes arsenatis TaxID=309797 RepID=UPI000419F5D2|nr:DUF3164 family protein [Chrysiogenes arsenatis]
MEDMRAIDYMKDGKGRLVPMSMVKPIDQARDVLVHDLVRKARAMRDDLKRFRADVFAEVGAFVDLSAGEFGVSLGGKKGNITLYSFDGSLKVQLAVADHLVFDERLQAAQALIGECVEEWSQGSRDEIKALISAAFQTDKEGKINTGRVLSLRRIDIKDERWQRAMVAIGESLTVVGSKSYIRFYERVGDSDQYVAIPLDVAAV